MKNDGDYLSENKKNCFFQNKFKKEKINGMESVVYGFLKKYFEIFIKNFHKDQLKLQTMKGIGTLNDLDLSEPVLQELLFIPTNLTVTKAHCKKMELQVSPRFFSKI